MSGAAAKKLGDLPEQGAYRGLCATCANASACTFPRNPERPVMNCDEFDGYGKGTQAGATVQAAAAAPVETDDPGKEKYKGLCRNCDLREDCVFLKPEGGVLNCEEYK